MRSEDGKMIAGVCAGLSDYLDIDPTLIRLAFVVLLFASGIGLPIYLVLAIVAPVDRGDNDGVSYEDLGILDGEETQSRSRSRFMAGLLILLGIFFLLGNFNVDWQILLPILLIALGLWQITHRNG